MAYPGRIVDILKAVFPLPTGSNPSRPNTIQNFDCFGMWRSEDSPQEWGFITEHFKPEFHSPPACVHMRINVLGNLIEPPWMPLEVIQYIQGLEEQGWRLYLRANIRGCRL